MSRETDRLPQFFTSIQDHEAHKREHPADDLGWPLCKCGACILKASAMNAAFIAAIMRGVDPERVDTKPHLEFDYDGDGGRGFMDELRDNDRGGRLDLGSWKPLGDSLPHIEAPSIAPTADADQPELFKTFDHEARAIDDMLREVPRTRAEET